jgi:hypothetical protein
MEFDAGCQNGLDRNRDDDQRPVQRGRRRELRQRTQPPMRQSRRGRRELVEMKHDKRCRKADTEGTWSESSLNSPEFNATLLISTGNALPPLGPPPSK